MQVATALEQWTGKSLTSKQIRKCEEIVTNYWTGAVINYLDSMFGRFDPDINLFFLTMDNNVLARCRNSSILYKFDSKKNFVKWYNYYDKMNGQAMTRRDVELIYELCDRYDLIEFIEAYNKASAKSISYIKAILESEGHKNRLLKQPKSYGPKKATNIEEFAKSLNDKMEEQDIKRSYESNGSDKQD